MLRTICAPHFVVFSYTLLSGCAPLPSEMLKALEHLRVAQSVFLTKSGDSKMASLTDFGQSGW